MRPLSLVPARPAAGIASITSRGDHALVAIPAGDRLFARLAAAQMAAVRAGRAGLRAARRDLRAIYPLTDLHRQERVAIGRRETELWFAYRDGRHRAPAAGEPWWEEGGAAHATIQSSGRIVSSNSACQALLGIGAQTTPMACDFLPRTVVREVTEPARSLSDLHELTSTTVMRDALGDAVPVEYHAVWDGDGPGRHGFAMRSFAQRDAASTRRAVAGSAVGRFAEGTQDELLLGARRHDLQPGERLPVSITRDRWMVLVVSGVVRLHLVFDTLEPTLVYGSTGSLVGTHWAVPNGAVAFGLQSVTSSTLLELDAGRFEDVAAADHRHARILFEEGRTLLREVVRLYAARTSSNLLQRLAREILVLAELHGDPVLVPVTEQQLADGVGSIRESVARALGELRRRSWLATTRHGLMILDRGALGALAADGAT